MEAHITSLRHTRQLSLRELARRSGLSAAFVCRVAQDESMPSEGSVRALAAALGVDGEELLHLAQQVPADAISAMRFSPKLIELVSKARALSG